MVQFLQDAGESPASVSDFGRIRRQHCGESCVENRKPPQVL